MQIFYFKRNSLKDVQQQKIIALFHGRVSNKWFRSKKLWKIWERKEKRERGRGKLRNYANSAKKASIINFCCVQWIFPLNHHKSWSCFLHKKLSNKRINLKLSQSLFGSTCKITMETTTIRMTIKPKIFAKHLFFWRVREKISRSASTMQNALLYFHFHPVASCA